MTQLNHEDSSSTTNSQASTSATAQASTELASTNANATSADITLLCSYLRISPAGNKDIIILTPDIADLISKELLSLATKNAHLQKHNETLNKEMLELYEDSINMQLADIKSAAEHDREVSELKDRVKYLEKIQIDTLDSIEQALNTKSTDDNPYPAKAENIDPSGSLPLFGYPIPKSKLISCICKSTHGDEPLHHFFCKHYNAVEARKISKQPSKCKRGPEADHPLEI